MHIYVYIHMCILYMHMCVYVCIYVYIQKWDLSVSETLFLKI